MLVITRSQLEMRQQSSLLVQQAMGTLDRRWVMNAPPPPTPPADDPQPSITDITDAVKTSFNRYVYVQQYTHASYLSYLKYRTAQQFLRHQKTYFAFSLRISHPI